MKKNELKSILIIVGVVILFIAVFIAATYFDLYWTYLKINFAENLFGMVN